MKQETYEKHLNNILEAHLILASMESNAFKYSAHSKLERAIYNNMKQISIHAGEKRIDMGEFQEKSNLLALCQYEFMIKKSLNFLDDSMLKRLIAIIHNRLLKVLDDLHCPLFSDKDEIVMVEIVKGDKLGLIEPDELEKWQGEFRRLLPVMPSMRFIEVSSKNDMFMNYNGDEKETVRFVMNDEGGLI